MSYVFLYLFMITSVIVGAGYLDHYEQVETNKVNNAHAAYCRSKDMTEVSTIERIGKSRTIDRFCVDRDGRVFWDAGQ